MVNQRQTHRSVVSSRDPVRTEPPCRQHCYALMIVGCAHILNDVSCLIKLYYINTFPFRYAHEVSVNLIHAMIPSATHLRRIPILPVEMICHRYTHMSSRAHVS